MVGRFLCDLLLVGTARAEQAEPTLASTADYIRTLTYLWQADVQGNSNLRLLQNRGEVIGSESATQVGEASRKSSRHAEALIVSLAVVNVDSSTA